MQENGINTVILSGAQRSRRIPWSHLDGFAAGFESPAPPRAPLAVLRLECARDDT